MNAVIRGILLVGVLFLLGGCATEVGIERVSPDERRDYGSLNVDENLLPETANLLGNFMLMEVYRDDPENFLLRMEKLYRDEPRDAVLTALADAAFNIAVRCSRNPDRAVRYYLASAIYSYRFLHTVDEPKNPYDAGRFVMMRIYNLSIAEIYEYLHCRKLHLSSDFQLMGAGDRQVRFLPPKISMASPEQFSDFELCSNYRPRNLTHFSHRSGLGAPLIAILKNDNPGNAVQFAEDQSLPATLMIDFQQSPDDHVHEARLTVFDSRNTDITSIGDRKIPLELDFSTPLAHMVRKPLPFGYIRYMIAPELSGSMQGLYRFEPFHPDRIPVVFVHGLMSNSRTWLQMINTLQNDPEIRKIYQFWGFSYSSGNPILTSAAMLREALTAERKRIVDAGISPEKFDRMVVAGHSMGGLLAKTLIMNPENRLLNDFFPNLSESDIAALPPEERLLLCRTLQFSSLKFVKRVVFIAVPHQGSLLSRSWIGRFGASLIRLPRKMVSSGKALVDSLYRMGRLQNKETHLSTGIDNLDPGSRALLALTKIPFAPGIPYHSIIGNLEGFGIPGGSDGIVPYASSHLDGAESEVVVASGHSVQTNPLAIQEMRRILLLHARKINP